ncbi:MAG: hypothetical protein KKA19_03590 [Candidatus Margulisbacteria bacterium]|nr:hypothetical protein [Candidatus Margulisiibacteriota bacterium]
MVNYEDLINKAKQEEIPQVSAGLWHRINETLENKDHTLHIPATIKAHPFLSSSVAVFMAAILLFFSLGFYQDIQLDNYLAGQVENLSSADKFFNYLETF